MEIIINDLKNAKKEEIKMDGFGQIPLIKGESAYELAVKHGFVGTEDDWIKSLKYDDTKIKEDISNKVDKISGKSLSTNDFTNEYKYKLDNLNNYDDTEIKNNISNKVDKVEGKGLSSNDFTTEEKEKLAKLSNYDDTDIRNELAEKYVKNTDYATTGKAGVIRIGNAVQLSNGVVKAQNVDYETYSNYSSDLFVGKGTLENVINGKELVNKTYVDDNINKTNAQQNKKIELLEEENKLLREQIPSGNVSGNSMHIEDSSNLDLDWRINGGHAQEILTGITKANTKSHSETYSGVTVTTDDNNIITLNGTATESINKREPKFIDNVYTLPAGDYYCHIDYVSGTLSVNEGYVDTGTVINIRGEETQVVNGNNKTIVLNNYKSHQVKKFTLEKEEAITTFQILTTPAQKFDNLKLRIWWSTSQENIYEPYVGGEASPNPDYPSEIETVGRNVNLLDESKALVKTENGITLSYSKSEGLILNGTTTAQTNFWINNLGINLETDSYTLSSNVSLENKGIYVLKAGSDNLIQSKLKDAVTFKSSKTIATQFWIQINAGVTFDNQILKIKLEKGSVATPYSPYEMGSVEIDVENENLFIDYTIEPISSFGITLNANKNGLSFNGSVTNQNYPSFTFYRDGSIVSNQWWVNKTYIKKEKGFFDNDITNKILSFISSGTLKTNQNQKFRVDIGYETQIKSFNFYEFKNNMTFLSDIQERINFVSFGFTPETTVSLQAKIKLEHGKKATEFIEHEQQTSIIPVQQ